MVGGIKEAARMQFEGLSPNKQRSSSLSIHAGRRRVERCSSRLKCYNDMLPVTLPSTFASLASLVYVSHELQRQQSIPDPASIDLDLGVLTAGQRRSEKGPE